MDKPIAVIGFGSLIWDLEILTPLVRGPWQMDKGPLLPLEFTRISPKRKLALALCIDLMDGKDCMTSVIHSTRTTVAEARRDLARRERAPEGFIGAICLNTGLMGGRPRTAGIVGQWCQQAGYSGAVWTDILPNFIAQQNVDWTVRDGIDYLKTLDEEGLAEAVQYIELAPRAVDTPLRRGLAKDDWWQEQKARFLPG